MTKFLIALTVLMCSLDSQAQFIHASVKKNLDPTKIDIVFKPNYTSTSGEYVNILQFALALPVGVAAGVTATAVGVNTFSNMGVLNQFSQFTEGSERIFSWVFGDPSIATQSWINDVEFVGVTVQFSTTTAASFGKMVDFSRINGGKGKTGSAYFSMASTASGDITDYQSLFFSIPAKKHTLHKTIEYSDNPSLSNFVLKESLLGTYSSGDQFVQTSDVSDKDRIFPTDEALTRMEVMVYPNPSEIEFNLRLKTRDNGEVTIRVLDINGKVIQVLKGTPDQLFRVGDQLLPGSYIAEVRQGNEKRTVKLIKQQ